MKAFGETGPTITAAEAAKTVPAGLYCYSHTGRMVETQVNGAPEGVTTPMHELRRCPYHETRADKPRQESGYCRYLRSGDWMPAGTMLLWDEVKECGINEDEPGLGPGLRNR